MTIAELSTHAHALREELGIGWVQSRGRFCAYSRDRIISTPSICSEADYATFLHELGHCETIDSWRHGKDFIKPEAHINTSGEAASWTWARAHALIWTNEMQATLRWCLATYRKYAAHGESDPIWAELDRVNGLMPIGRALYLSRQLEMNEREQTIARWSAEVEQQTREQYERERPMRERELLIERWKQEIRHA